LVPAYKRDLFDGRFMSSKVCFLGGARYSRPLDATSRKKFSAMKSLGEMFVIGFSGELGPRWFTEHAKFYLLPTLPFAPFRYAEMLLLGVPLAVWVIARHGVQVLVAQSPYEGFAAALAKKICRWFGHKIVLVVESHGDFEESVFMQRHVLLPWLYRLLMRLTANFALKHADAFRTISDSTRRQLENRMPGRPIVQFPAWTDMDAFLAAGVNGNIRSQVILYTGVLIPRKGVHHLIDAFAQTAKDFAQASLVIIGHDENRTYAAGLKNRVAQLGLEERVQFLPPMSQGELATWMHRARAFVLPSLSEGLGRVVFEAMASGTPVIGSRVGGIPDMIEDGVTGFLVPPGDELSLADKICWLLAHPSEAHAMGKRARLAAEQLFSTDTYIGGFREVFAIAQDRLADEGQHAHSTV
jgi:glycosyltransferase involved in cell wall biosynthesis